MALKERLLCIYSVNDIQEILTGLSRSVFQIRLGYESILDRVPWSKDCCTFLILVYFVSTTYQIINYSQQPKKVVAFSECTLTVVGTVLKIKKV